MSELRDKLAQAQAGYESIRYPGDLADQMLGSAQRRGRAWWIRASVAIASAAGLAAMIAITLLKQSPNDVGTGENPIAIAEVEPLDLSVPGLPEMPQSGGENEQEAAEVSFALPGMPTMPSLNDLLSADASVEQ